MCKKSNSREGGMYTHAHTTIPPAPLPLCTSVTAALCVYMPTWLPSVAHYTSVYLSQVIQLWVQALQQPDVGSWGKLPGRIKLYNVCRVLRTTTSMCHKNLCQQGWGLHDVLRILEVTKPQFRPEAKNIRVRVNLGHLLPCCKTLLDSRSPVNKKDEIKLLWTKLNRGTKGLGTLRL